MGILNYTTTATVNKSLVEIQELLARAGAQKVMTDYENGQPVAVSFLIETPWGKRGFHLPANAEKVFAVLTRQYSSGRQRSHTATPTREQAARVGWRIVKDWLEAQLAIIEAEVVSFEQVMLPYMVVETDTTLYQLMQRNQLALPGPKE